ncbi:unnamed protein product [Phyllotreta striolata]|uniref:Uncharacterized protein n=1 Tax=Phyllotreta striolata TaxID=444603 RepID=A0A9N9XTU6_PHYSR|nr:unnamed protein product [Phyllotreta striolata]
MVNDKCEQGGKTKSEWDAESLIERCWRPQKETDSRPYLIRDASYRSLLEPDPKCSITRSSYAEPVYDDRPTLGIRKSQMLKQFQAEAEAEIAKERTPEKPTGTYVTNYDCYHRIPGFHPDDKFYMKENELYGKYPLYSTRPPITTVTSFKLKRNADDLSPGITRVFDKNNPFRKCSGFSKPVHEKLDGSW